VKGGCAGEIGLSRRRVLALGVAIVGGGLFGRAPHSLAQQPTPTAWDLGAATTTNLERLGKIILLERSPYASGTNLNSRKYAASSFWQQYVQRDDGGANWQFQRKTLYVERTLRIPYFVTEGNVEALDHLLVGYTEPVRKVPNPGTDAWAPIFSGTFNNDYERLGKMLMYDLNKSFTGTAGSPGVAPGPNWDTNARIREDRKLRWTFRDHTLRVEKAIAIQYRVDEDGWQRSLLLVGYEGAGGY
jgi:hypothetical protein